MCIILTDKHGGGRVMVWSCFAGPGQLAVTDRTMNSAQAEWTAISLCPETQMHVDYAAGQ